MNNKTVLIVEDDEETKEIYKKMLEVMNYDVNSAESAEKALEYSQENFDVLLTDGLEGKCFKVVEKITAGRKIIISGDENLINEAKQNGFEAYLKPVGLIKIL